MTCPKCSGPMLAPVPSNWKRETLHLCEPCGYYEGDPIDGGHRPDLDYVRDFRGPAIGGPRWMPPPTDDAA